MPIETTFVLLFSIATAVAIAVRRLRVPYTVALVVVGLVLGTLRIVEAPHLTKALLFALILPGLIFEAAFNLDAREFWESRLAIGALSVPGVVISIMLTAAIVTPAMAVLGLDPTFDWRYGLVFGALIAATDPIAVVALFKRLHVPHRLAVLVEGESLLNDGTAVVFFTLILAYVGGGVTTAGAFVGQFLAIVGGGIAVGTIVGIVATQVTKRIDEPMIEITLTVIAAYGSFVVAEQLHFSGVIATVAAGLVCGSYGWQVGMSPPTRLAVETFWDYVAFALNSIVFLLMGFEVRFPTDAVSWALIGIAWGGALAARLGVAAVVSVFLRPTRERIPRAWAAVLTWGGLRGALSMVLALALPASLPHRAQLVTMTYGVVFLSLLVQGLSMSRLLRRLGLVEERDDLAAHDRARGQLQAVDAALAEIERMTRSHAASPDILAAMRRRYEARRDAAVGRLTDLHLAQADLTRGEAIGVVRRLLLAERARLSEALDEGHLRADAVREISQDVDARLARLDAGQFEEPEELLGADDG